jgi:hypothetical protein
MSGKRTLVSLLVALISIVCAGFGIDFGALLAELGITPEAIVAEASGESGGKLNLLVSAIAIVAAAIFRVIARRTVFGGKPLDPPKPPPLDGAAGNGGSQFMAAALACALLIGCAPLVQPAAPHTLRQSLASAWIAHGKANKDITDLRRAQLINAQTFREWAAEIDRWESRLTMAQRLLDAGSPAQAQTWLDQALDIMSRLQPLIQEKLDELEYRSGVDDRQRSHEDRARGAAAGAQRERSRLAPA